MRAHYFYLNHPLKRDIIGKWNFIRKRAVRNHLKSPSEKSLKIESSENIAFVLFPMRNATHSGSPVRQWADYCIHQDDLPIHNQGKCVKTKSLIHDEDVKLILRKFVPTEKDSFLTSTKLADWINENLGVRLRIGSQSAHLLEKHKDGWMAWVCVLESL